MTRRLAVRHRHAWAATLAGALALAALAAPAAAIAQGPSAAPTVAIMYFNNGSLVDHDDYEPMRKGMADILITEMQSNPRIRVIERDALQKLLDEQKLGEEKRTDPATSARIGKLLGAQHMIVGGFFIDRKGRLRLDARSVNVETSEVEHVETTAGNADDVLEVIAELARKLNAGLKLPGKPEGTRDRNPASSGTPHAKLDRFERRLVDASRLAVQGDDDLRARPHRGRCAQHPVGARALPSVPRRNQTDVCRRAAAEGRRARAGALQGLRGNIGAARGVDPGRRVVVRS